MDKISSTPRFLIPTPYFPISKRHLTKVHDGQSDDNIYMHLQLGMDRAKGRKGPQLTGLVLRIA